MPPKEIQPRFWGAALFAAIGCPYMADIFWLYLCLLFGEYYSN